MITSERESSKCLVGMTDDELKVWQDLITTWGLFCNLNDPHPDHVADFRRAIHECQRILAVRVMIRLCNDVAEVVERQIPTGVYVRRYATIREEKRRDQEEESRSENHGAGEDACLGKD